MEKWGKREETEQKRRKIRQRARSSKKARVERHCSYKMEKSSKKQA
jgi:hypothetical protein